jgi:hypothetical protein
MGKHKIYLIILPSVSVPDLLTIFCEVMFENNLVLSMFLMWVTLKEAFLID